ncbi:nitroreductase family deazaflavin-dependent oxidoreductase [soil metagenome]
MIDSPTGWVAQHIREYVESGGEKGHQWRGVPTLLLTTRGRRTGTLRRSALIYGRSGDNYVVVGSKGGAKSHPLWYLNLVAEPSVDVQVGPERFKADARTATGSERAELWRMMAEIFPTYDTYEQKTERQIPIVVLEPR